MSEGISVLMIDDNPADGDTVRRHLADEAVSWEVEFEQVLSAEEALSELEDRRFDVLFVDYHFPFGNGFDILRKIRGNGVDSPAVMLTGQGDEEVASQAVAENLTAYLPKAKLAPETLAETLRTALGQGSVTGSVSGDRGSRTQGSDSQSKPPGPGGLLSRLSGRLSKNEPCGLLLVEFPVARVPVTLDSIRGGINEFLERWLDGIGSTVRLHRIGECRLGGLIEEKQLEELVNQSESALAEAVNDVFPGDGDETGVSGVRVLVTDVKNTAADPAVPINDGLDQLVSPEMNGTGDRVVQVTKGVA